MAKYGRAGIIGRFKPFHNGHFELLKNVCESSETVLIGIGSSNCYNASNPFTPAETKDMIMRALPYDNFVFLDVPDFNDGEKWVDYVLGVFGNLDVFVTGNEYVGHLLSGKYKLVHACELTRQCPISATQIRVAIARNEPWSHLVPKKVADYLVKKGLDERLRKEFGSVLTSDVR